MVDVHERAKSAISLLLVRQVAIQVLTFGGSIVLARILAPAQFGVYAIASFVVGTLAMFGDFGLAPSFIQRKEELTERDLRVAFTLQLILTTMVVVVLNLASPLILRIYPKAPAVTVWLVRILSFTLFLTAIRSMSALQMERHLHYGKLAWIEVVESLSFQGLAVGLALAGLGVWSFIWAALARSLLGALLAYLAQPWRFAFVMDKHIAMGILRYGIPFQFINLIHGPAQWMAPLAVGSIVGPKAVGYLTWASSNGNKPLTVVDNVIRVILPHFSRIQGDAELTQDLLMRYLNLLYFPSGLWLTLLVTIGRPAVEWIYTAKWAVAVPALMLYAGAMFINVGTWVAGTVLNSTGRIKYNTKIIGIRSCILVIVGIPLIFRIGFIAVPIVFLIGEAVSLPLTLRGLGPSVATRILTGLSWVLIPIAGGLIAGAALVHAHMSAMFHAIIGGVAVTSVYMLAVMVVGPPGVKQFISRRIGRLVGQ